MEAQKGKGFWKLNTEWLKNINYKEGVINTINDTYTLYNNQVDSRQLWDLCKISMKEYSIRFAVSESKKKAAHLKNIENQIAEYESQMLNASRTEIGILNNLKRELELEHDEIYKQKVKGAQIRSRSKWVSEGESDANFFKSLEQRHQTNNKITCLKDENGDILHQLGGCL